ncbi:hypothetical protein [Acinetobacter nosocomialis]|uniref:hypothetical protein n=1 Tax=Acinetobacter nosocomialis TaxID=106654 RepID=UPI00124E926F|nr:hypothetical protein [Acinetobacter nosocomialis]MBO8207350.1 hypothetical protein [Acinetobacter nosocomialis]MBO8223801.1 hypothetical protein [Acinetobacter nosocomialis]MBO8250890.1 hypothetical protein [Acinetobacter nosocomialis]MPS59906.1 hypothetical protein [Acinetobacter sp.]
MLTYKCSEFKILIMHELDNFNVAEQNIDFNVTVDNIIYAGTAVTLKNIEYLMNNFRATGDCHFGRYFWQSNMLILEEMTIDCLRAALLDIVKDKTLNTLDDMFYKINCDS